MALLRTLVSLILFIYACELYFKLTNLNSPSQQALMALLWLEGEAAVWWQSVKVGYLLD